MDEHEEHPNDIGGPARGVPQHDRLGRNEPEQQLQATSAPQQPHHLHNWGERVLKRLLLHNNQFHLHCLVDIPNMHSLVSQLCLDIV